MTRSTLGTTNRAEVAKPTVRMIELVEFAFPSATLRYCTADHDIDVGGVTYTASKVLGSVDGISEHSDLKSRRIAFKLSGLDDTILTKLMNDAYSYATVKLYWGFCGEDWRLLATPYQVSDDFIMSNAVLTIDDQTGEVELSAETWDLIGNRDSAVLATPETQRLRYAGDTGMDKVAAILSQQIEWGSRTQKAGTPNYAPFPGRDFDGVSGQA